MLSLETRFIEQFLELIYFFKVHKETIDKIPAALPGKDSVEIEVYGMEGIPDDAQGSGTFHFLINMQISNFVIFTNFTI